MLKCRWIGVVVVAGALSGCASKPPPPPPAPPAEPVGTSTTLESAREQLTRANPNTQVGEVVAVLPESNLAAIGEMTVANFHVGDPITFLDGNLNSLTQGTVIVIKGGNLHVRYEPPAGHRVPQVGDIAVRIFNGVPPAPQATASGDATPPPAPTEPAPAPPAPTPPPAPAPTPTPDATAPPATAPAPAPPATGPSAPQPELNK